MRLRCPVAGLHGPGSAAAAGLMSWPISSRTRSRRGLGGLTDRADHRPGLVGAELAPAGLADAGLARGERPGADEPGPMVSTVGEAAESPAGAGT